MIFFARCALAIALVGASSVQAQALDYGQQQSWPAVRDGAQSPIDIQPAQARDGDPQEPRAIRLTRVRTALKVVDNGHAVEVEAKGPSALIRGRHFKLQQFHFHAESEHTIDGQHFPLEGHFVFRADDGRLAVIGVMYREGRPNALAGQVLGALGDKKEGEVPPGSILALMPRNLGYFHYLGSLTTPPLTENVEWYVLKEPASLSAEQLAGFQARYSHNNRSLQALNGRPLIRFR